MKDRSDARCIVMFRIIAACRQLVERFIPTASDMGAERADFMQQLGRGLSTRRL